MILPMVCTTQKPSYVHITVSAIVLKCLNGRILFVPRFSKSGELLMPSSYITVTFPTYSTLAGMELLPLSHILLWTVDIRKTLLSYLEVNYQADIVVA